MVQHRTADMSLSSILGLALVAALCMLSAVVDAQGGGEIIITLDKISITNNANDIWDAWEAEIHSTKKSSQISVKLPTKGEMTDTMNVKIVAKMGDGDPMETVLNACEALTDDSIGKSFVDAGLPKDSFPKECPFSAGDWSVSKWSPPTDQIPPGVPDGPVTGTISFFEEGKDPIILIDYEGELSHG